MTGFRSGKSGSLIRRAKAAGRAIGKRRVRHGSLSLTPPAAFNIPPPGLLSPKTSNKDTATIPRRIVAQNSTSPLINQEPTRPKSVTAEMWEDYRIFKAAGLLAEWREKWAWYLPSLA